MASEIGISKIGFTTADHFDYLEKTLRLSVEQETNSGFEHQNIAERIEPKLTLKTAKTIIAVALAYPNRLPQKASKSRYKRGKFSPSSWGRDYHVLLQEKMALLAQKIEAAYGHFDYKAMVDTGALVDTAVARRAGIGFIGKNGLVTSKEYGSYLFLGELITNLEIEPDKPVDYGCGDCTRCITSCPTKCLNGDSTMNARRCLSFQTQDKGMMADEFRPKIKTTIYGCDICQITCPYNKGIHNPPITEIDSELAEPELIPFLSLSNRQFKDKFGEIAGSWRGKTILQRNAIIALANANDRTAIPALTQIIKDSQNPIHVATAIWAIGQIGKVPDDETLALVQSIKSDNDYILTEKEKLLRDCNKTNTI